MTGNGGDDELNGGAGADHMDGSGNATTAGDVVSYADRTAAEPVTVTLNDAVPDGGSSDGAGDDVDNVERVFGGEGNDSLTATGNVVNVLDGNGGDDTLDGGPSADTIDGDTGNDTVSYASRNQAVTVTLGDATATTAWAARLRATACSASRTALGGTAGDSLTGSDEREQLHGNGGSDTLDGQGAADLLDGGAGTGDTADYSARTAAVTRDARRHGRAREQQRR